MTTITATPSASTVGTGMVIQEFSDTGTATFDQVSAVNVQSATNAAQTLALTPAITGELSIALFIQGSSGSDLYTGTNGWSCTNGTDTSGSGTGGCYKIISGTASTTATASINATINSQGYQSLYKP